MTIVWTEAFSSFTPSGSGWQNYDLFTNKSVPKGAIAYIICASVNDATARSVGVRTDGSSLNRYILLHEGEDGGVVDIGMNVKVDELTGYIETYCDSTTGVTFYLMGYWTGVDFTELATITTGGTAGWFDYNAFTALSIPKGSVIQFACMNLNNGASEYMGVRTGGSSIERYLNIHEAESASSEFTDGNGYTVCVKSNASTGIVQCRYGPDKNYWVLGYFESTMDYVELAPTYCNITSANTWTDYDASASLDQDGRVVDCLCMHANTAAEMNCGARKNGSSLDRYILEHEAESNGITGHCVPTESDASGIIEFYCGHTTLEYVGIIGYYKWTAVTSHVISDGVGVSDGLLRNKTFAIIENMSSSDGFGVPARTLPMSDSASFVEKMLANKSGLTMSDVMGIVEALKTPSKSVIPRDSATLSEALKQPTKSVIQKDSVSGSDAEKTPSRTILSPNTVGASDIDKVNKALDVVLDSITQTVASKTPSKSVISPNTVTASDADKVNKPVKLTDTVTQSVASKTPSKSVISAQTVNASDADKVNKTLPLSDSAKLTESSKTPSKSIISPNTLQASDVDRVNKTLPLADSITQTVSSKTPSKSIIPKESVTSSDAPKINKALELVADVLRATEALKTPTRSIRSSQTVTVTDKSLAMKTLKLADVLRLTEASLFHKPLTFINDIVDTSELILRNRNDLVITDSANLVDKKSLIFNGTGIELANPVLDFQDSFTVCCWLRRFTLPRQIGQYYLCLGSAVNSRFKFHIYNNTTGSYSTGQVNIFYRDPVNYGGGYYRSFTAQPGRDYFIASAWDKAAGKLYFYLDGNVLGGPIDYPYDYMRVSDKIEFGQGSPVDVKGQCAMHDVMLFNGVKSQAEIQALMTTNPTGSESDLVAYWPMNEGSGTTLNDLGPNNISGSIGGAYFSPGDRTEKDLLLSDVLDLTDDAIVNLLGKLILLSDGLTLADAIARTQRSMSYADTLHLAEVIRQPVKNAIIKDTLALVQSLKTNKTFRFAQTVTLSDIIKANKPVTIADAYHAVDKELMNKFLKVLDSATLTDTVLRMKLFAITEALTCSDLVKTNKKLTIQESLELEDALNKLRTIILQDSVGLEDEAQKLFALILKLTRLRGLLESDKLTGDMETQSASGTTSQSGSGSIDTEQIQGTIHINSL